MIQKNCVICGNPRKSELHPLCMNCNPFLYKKQAYPHQKLRRKKRWLEKRKEILDKVDNRCEWCGNTQQSLAIHHTKEVNSRKYEHIWNTLLGDEINTYLQSTPEKSSWVENYFIKETKKALRSSIKHYEQKAKNFMTKACPYCDSTNYIVRKTIIPKYKCNGCKKTFEELKPRPRRDMHDKLNSLKSQSQEKDISKLYLSGYSRQKIFGNFTGELLPILYPGLKVKYEKKVNELLEEYLEMRDTIVLCIKCHNAVRLGLKLCGKCKKNYHTSKYHQCSKCREATDPIARKIRKVFGISKHEAWQRRIGEKCILCGDLLFEDFSALVYGVYLAKKDGTIGKNFGTLCEDCYMVYSKTGDKMFIAKESEFFYDDEKEFFR